MIYSDTKSLELDWSFATDIILDSLSLEFGIIYLIVGKNNIALSQKINTQCYKFFVNSLLHSYSVPEKIKILLKNNYAYEINKEKVLS
jgi:hypothetical protein